MPEPSSTGRSPETEIEQGATFDPTGQYRYHLWRRWQPARPTIAWLLLNPSTANATVDDPTLRACRAFTQRWGYGGLEVVNLFAYCTPQPQELRRVIDPVGPDNDRHIQAVLTTVAAVVLAWGNGGGYRQRDRVVLDQVARSQPALPWYCLGLTQAGQPRHPLYVARATALQPFVPPAWS